jgi:hypothetical protein
MARAFLEHGNGEHIGELVTLNPTSIIVGRASSCNIVIEPKFTSVSQRHAVFHPVANGWAIVDIGTLEKGSTYGTYLNEIRLVPNVETILNPGDEIRLGTKLGKYFKYRGEGTIPVSEQNLRGRFVVDEGKRAILIDGRVVEVPFTPLEFNFILVLWRKPGIVCPFIEICTILWPQEKNLNVNSIDADLKVRINTLAHSTRCKLKSALDGLDIIESSRGIGYRLKF